MTQSSKNKDQGEVKTEIVVVCFVCDAPILLTEALLWGYDHWLCPTCQLTHNYQKERGK